MDYHESLKRQLKEYRRKRDITQEELAAIFNVSTQTISGWETTKSPSIESAMLIADTLGVSLDFLFGRTEEDSDTAAKTITAIDSIFDFNPTDKVLKIEKYLDVYLHEVEKAKKALSDANLPDDVYQMWIKVKQDEYRNVVSSWKGEKEYVMYDVFEGGERERLERAISALKLANDPFPAV